MAPIHIPNELWITLSYLGFAMCAIPFYWHLEAWNTATCLFMAWAGLANLNQAINSTVWNGNAINKAPIWCDISSRFFLGAMIAIPTANMCVNRRLYQIASVRSVTVTQAEKRRVVIVDLAIGIGIPIIYMILCAFHFSLPSQGTHLSQAYIPQGHRFNIFEDIGCFPATYTTPVALVLVSLPPLLIGCVSAVYSILSIWAFAKSHRQFQQLLPRGTINTNRYIRLMMLAGIETFLNIPCSILAIYETYIARPMYPWRGWADTHYNFSQVFQVPAVIWRSNALVARGLELNRLGICLTAFIFFAFFGFAEEARKNYRLGLQSVTKHMGISTSITFFSSTGSKIKGTFTSSMVKGGTLPVSIERHVFRKHDSITSFTDVSVSFSDAGSTLDEKKDEKDVLTPASSYDHLHLSDVGGTLADLKTESNPEPHLPTVAVTRPSSLVETQRSIPPRHLSDSSAV
ncbi:hypothetical protein C0993_012366 [Termitomyces sp. T159_Od127]|nr:hypothetical protein C0993_012366 [Termitomyces sp. T159_Od127]